MEHQGLGAKSTWRGWIRATALVVRLLRLQVGALCPFTPAQTGAALLLVVFFDTVALAF
jgi:hypothetical protein